MTSRDPVQADPRAIYEERLGRASNAVESLDRVDARLGNARLAAFCLAAAVAWPTLLSRVWSLGWFLLVVALFVGLILFHGRSLRDLGRERRRVEHYRNAICRVMGEGFVPIDEGGEFTDDAHPYSSDLDLFGPGSLYARLCTARTRVGRSTLAGWLTGPADRREIELRQEAVSELASGLEFREEVALLAAELEPRITVAELEEWGRAPVTLRGRWVPILLGLAGAANLLATIGWLFGGVDRLWLLASFALSGLLVFRFRSGTKSALETAGRPAGELRFVASVMRRVENEPWASEKLAAFRRSGGVEDALDGTGHASPSHRIGELARLMEWNDSRRNDLFLPIASLLLLGTQLAFAVERWRARHGEQVANWLRELGEVEALSSLATFHFENPDSVFPEIASGSPQLDAVEIEHPLLPPESRVPNTVKLEGELQLLLVSGSNMSGKSTLMRTVGVSAVLAYAGGSVCAERLRLTPLSIGASLHVQDSLAAGVSRFYAELRRLARVRELAEAGPTLFLLDEILHGTNSHDRGIGARGVIEMLLEHGAIGFVTTHDLALTRVAQELAPRALNVHFEDHVENGEMAFDYTLRPGPVERGNALALMRTLELGPDTS